MPTTLVVAEPKDRLAQRVCGLIPQVIRCTERELFATCGFALLQDGTSVEGTLTLAGQPLPLAQLSGVLFRPARRWRPPSGLGARHRAFVRHETQAAWCAVLNALTCPVLNRMAPAWWLDDTWYRAHLAQAFAQQLDLPLSSGGDGWGERGVLSGAPSPETLASAYAVGKHLVVIDQTLSALESHLAAHAAELAQWQHATGIGFARIDFVHRSGYAVERVEPLPAMGRAREALLDSVSRRVAEALA